MAGPGGGGSSGGFSGGSFGGSHGGGGFGGGSFGGSNNGGSFGGNFRHNHHHGPHFHGPYFGWGRPRRVWRYGPGGGGCFSVLVIGLFILFAVIWFIGEPVGQSTVIYEESGIVYDEGTMQDYANEKYNQYFTPADSETYEDNILLVFLTNEETDGYYTIAWVGDNIKSEINEMFGEYTEYGQALSENISDYYAYSLDTNLASAVYFMTDSITQLGLDSSFYEARENAVYAESRIENLTSIDISTEVVNRALYAFTEKTGIPVVIVVDSCEKVFGADTPVSARPSDENIGSDDGYVTAPIVKKTTFAYVPVIVSVIILVAAVVIVLKNKKGGKAKGNTEGKGEEKPPWEM